MTEAPLSAQELDEFADDLRTMLAFGHGQWTPQELAETLALGDRLIACARQQSARPIEVCENGDEVFLDAYSGIATPDDHWCKITLDFVSPDGTHRLRDYTADDIRQQSAPSVAEIACAIADGFSNGNDQFYQSSLAQQERYTMAAESVASRLALPLQPAPDRMREALVKVAHHVTRMNRASSGADHAESVARDCTQVFASVGMSNNGDGWAFDESAREALAQTGGVSLPNMTADQAEHLGALKADAERPVDMDTVIKGPRLFDAADFASRITARMGERSYRNVAPEVGVSTATLHRTATSRGEPDINSYLLISKWLATPTAEGGEYGDAHPYQLTGDATPSPDSGVPEAALPESVLAFDDFLNHPHFLESEAYQIRDYRHDAYPRWAAALKDLRAMLAAAQVPPTGQEGWRPIESAPKDGTPILAWCVHPHARYAGDDKDWAAPVVTQWTTFNGGGWTWHGMIGRFTHWHDLPEPPAPQSPHVPAGEGKTP